MKSTYWAFISYSHKDKAWGSWIHRALETYRVPKRLVGTDGRDGPVPARIAPIFRDREELPTSANLGAVITEALNSSAYLIVVCSPRSAASRWVGEEIREFQKLGRSDRILCLIVDGEPNDETQECFAEPLKYSVDAAGEMTQNRAEPIAADARAGKDGKSDAHLKLVAGLIGVGFDALKQRELHRRNRRLVGITASALAITTLAVTLSVLALLARNDARRQRTVAQAAQAEEARQHARADQRTLDAQRQLAESMLAQGNTLTLAGQWAEARKQYREARETFRSAGVSPFPATVGLWETYRRSPPELNRLSGHSDTITGLVFDPKGRFLLTSSSDETLKMWDIKKGSLIKTLEGKGATLNTVAISPDGRTAVTGAVKRYAERFVEPNERIRLERSLEQSLALWNLETGTYVRAFGPRSNTSAVAFMPDGKHVVAARPRKTIEIWNVETREVLKTLTGHDNIITALAVSPNGRALLSASEDGTVIVWDLESAAKRAVFSAHTGGVYCVAWSPDGRLAASAGADRIIRLWEVETRREIRTFAGHTQSIQSVAFSADGRRLISGSGDSGARLLKMFEKGRVSRRVNKSEDYINGEIIDRTVRVWEIESGSELRTFSGHSDSVMAVAFSPDGRFAVSAGGDNVARIWSASSDSDMPLWGPHPDEVTATALSPDARLALVGCKDGTVYVREVATGKTMISWKAHQDEVADVHILPGGHRALSSSPDSTLAVWNLADGTLIHRFVEETGWITSLGLSGDGTRALTVSIFNSNKLWDLDKHTLIRNWRKRTTPVVAVALSPDGTRALTIDNRTIFLWDADTGTKIKKLDTLESDSLALAFSHDGRWAAAGTIKGDLLVWDIASGRKICSVNAHFGGVERVRFTPDGRWIMTSSSDATWKLWSTAHWKQVHVFHGHPYCVKDLSLTPDGRMVITGSEDKTTRLWDFTRPEQYEAWEARLEAARKNPDDPASILTFGQWYVFRGIWDWAIDFLDRAPDAPPMTKARCYWILGKHEEARREFEKLPADDYTRLCLRALRR